MHANPSVKKGMPIVLRNKWQMSTPLLHLSSFSQGLGKAVSLSQDNPSAVCTLMMPPCVPQHGLAALPFHQPTSLTPLRPSGLPSPYASPTWLLTLSLARSRMGSSTSRGSTGLARNMPPSGMG